MVTLTIMIRVFIMENDLKFFITQSCTSVYVHIPGWPWPPSGLLGQECDGICTSHIMAMKAASVLASCSIISKVYHRS